MVMVDGFAPGTFRLPWCLKKGSKGRMIELFKQPNIDWMGKAKYFYVLSGILLLAGWASILFGSGIRYGIDFKGGTNVDVRFSQPPNVDRLRSSLAAQGLGNTEIQSISDIANPNSNEVVIDRKSTRLNSSHQIISYAVFCLKKKNRTLKRTMHNFASPLTS